MKSEFYSTGLRAEQSISHTDLPQPVTDGPWRTGSLPEERPLSEAAVLTASGDQAGRPGMYRASSQCGVRKGAVGTSGNTTYPGDLP